MNVMKRNLIVLALGLAISAPSFALFNLNKDSSQNNDLSSLVSSGLNQIQSSSALVDKLSVIWRLGD